MKPAKPPAKKATMPSLAPAMERDTPDECPECGGDDVIENWSQGTSECRSCGLVIQERLFDLGSEWRTFAQEEGDDPNRVGGPANPLLEGELGTGIGASGPGGGRLNMALNRAQNRNAVSNADKVMMQVIQRIDRIADRLKVPGAVGKRAKEIFKAYNDVLTKREDGSRSRSLREGEILDMMSGCLFIACRNSHAERSFKEVARVAGVSRKTVGAYVKKIELAVPGAKTVNTSSVGDLITRFCTNLSLSREVINRSMAVSDKLHDDVLYGKTYSTVAASAIYIVTLMSPKESRKPPADIASVSGVAEVTIKSAYKLMYPRLKPIITPEFITSEQFDQLPPP